MKVLMKEEVVLEGVERAAFDIVEGEVEDKERKRKME